MAHQCGWKITCLQIMVLLHDIRTEERKSQKMNSKGRVTSLKHRATKQKRQKQRIIARQLLKGEITTDQVRSLVGDGYNGVLKTADYIVNKEGFTISSVLASDIAMVVSPAIYNSREKPKAKPAKNTPRKAQQSPKNEITVAIGKEELLEQEAPTSDKPKTTPKRKTASKKEASIKGENTEEKPKRQTTSRKKTTSTKAKSKTE